MIAEFSIFFTFFLHNVLIFCLQNVLVLLQECLVAYSCHKQPHLTDCSWFCAPANSTLAVFLFLDKRMGAYRGLKIHYKLSLCNRSYWIGNLPTTEASSWRKSMWNLLFLISVLVASPQSRVSDCVMVLCKKSDLPRLRLVMISVFLVQL